MLESCWQCGAAGAPTKAATGSPNSPPLLAPHRLLTSNDVPLDSETPFIRGIVSEGQNQVDALNSQIENMEDAILRLTRKRDELAEHVHQHRAILAPVRRVPPELVGEILALSLPSDNRPPWHLAHICRFWRHCVLGYPALWNSITIPFSSSPDLLPMIETQLIRSVNTPLNIFWSAFEDEDTPDLRAAALLVSHSNRWRALLLDNSHYSIQLNWLHAANGRLATLETLQVRGEEIEIPDIFSAAPSLCKVFLTNWYFGASAPVSAIPWAQLTHYAGSFTADLQVEIVKTTPNLVSCAIGFPYWVNSFAPGDPAVLPHLQRLCIEMAGFLPRLEAPLLQELYCSYSGRLQGRSEILPFVERSACLLQKLSLMRCSIDSDLITVLGGLPSVRNLIIEVKNGVENYSEQGDLFDALANDLCPSLTSLAYGFGSDFAVDAFLDMAKTRFQLEPPRPRFTQLRLFRSHDYHVGLACPPSIAAAVQNVRDDGFDVDFLERGGGDIFIGKHFFC